MRYLSLPEVLELHNKIIEVSGGARNISFVMDKGDKKGLLPHHSDGSGF